MEIREMRGASTRSLAALAAALLSLPAPAAPPDPAAPAPRRQKLAVLELRPIGVPKGDADLLSEVAATEASRFRSLEIIGQSEVGALLGLERQKQLLGCKEDSACMAEIGGALGADLILIGSIGRMGDLRRLDLRVLDVRRARVLGRTGETIEGKSDLLIGAVQRGVRELLAPIGGQLTPAAGAAVASAPLPAAPVPEKPAMTATPAPEAGGPPRAGATPKRHSVAVQRGREILVLSHKNWRPGCLPAPLPEIRVVEPPRQGKVEIRPGDYPIPAKAWNRDVDSAGCLGRKVPGLGIYYLAPAAPGRDSFRYELTGSGRARHRFDVTVDVVVE